MILKPIQIYGYLQYLDSFQHLNNAPKVLKLVSNTTNKTTLIILPLRDVQYQKSRRDSSKIRN